MPASPQRPAGAPVLATVTHQSRECVERLLPGATAVAEALGSELIAVDNASTDGTAEVLRQWERRTGSVRVVARERNLGYAAGVNAALRAAGGSDVMVVNPDVRLDDPDPVRELAAFLEGRQTAGAVGPRLLDPDRSVQPSARRFPTPAAVAGSMTRAGRIGALRRSRDRYLEPSRATAPASVDWVMGAAMLIRAEAFEAVGGWDEGYFLYVEDADFCRRLRHAGWDVVYHPGVALVHDYARESSGAGASIVSSLARRRHVTSFARFWSRDPLSAIGRSPARVR